LVSLVNIFPFWFNVPRKIWQPWFQSYIDLLRNVFLNAIKSASTVPRVADIRWSDQTKIHEQKFLY
jgi:hypothetical protein